MAVVQGESITLFPLQPEPMYEPLSPTKLFLSFAVSVGLPLLVFVLCRASSVIHAVPCLDAQDKQSETT